MDSPKTRAARAARVDAADDWRNHRKVCSQCDQAAHARRPRGMCERGRALNRAFALADSAYRVERAADATPNPDQEPLFEIEG